MKRFFDTVPGICTWLTLILMFLLSWLLPVWVSIFIILFDVYWLLKTIFLSFHLRATFTEMKKNMKIDWLARLEERRTDKEGKDWRDIVQLVILPMYNEPYEVVRESFLRLAAAHYPKDKMIVVLALEARAGADARETGSRIEAEFKDTFYKFLITVHPEGLPDEIPGKGSNESWAGMRAKEEVIDPARISYDRILVSVFDIDTQIFPEYFGRLTYTFFSSHDPLRAIYQPVPLFVNNLSESNALSRVVSFSCTFWQMMQQSRPERLTSFSSQSMSFETLTEIGFWQKDIVSEDSRIFWQGVFRYHGDFRTEPLFFPVAMDAPSAPTFFGTMKNIYKQQRRWAWGSENVPYLLEGFREDKTIPKKKRWYWTFNSIEGYHSWATNSLMIFALGWLPLFLGGKHYNETLLAYNLPHITRFIIMLSMIGVASSAILSILILPPRQEKLRIRDYGIYILQWVLMPFTLIIFGAIPGIEAQTRLALGGKWRLGFWVTPKGRHSETGKGSGKR
jgi:cellulose synthase/poly-beta-1,6-N-acetylglucosamine synthase-like glycosyltransferase